MEKYTFLILRLSLLLGGCQGEKPREDIRLKARLQHLLENTDTGDTTLFALDTMTNFEWDTLYIFGTVAQLADFHQVLGYNWTGARPLTEYDEMFIFVKNRKVAAHVFFNGSNYGERTTRFRGSYLTRVPYPRNKCLFGITSWLGKIKDVHLVKQIAGGKYRLIYPFNR
jgi:hypothetical protein